MIFNIAELLGFKYWLDMGRVFIDAPVTVKYFIQFSTNMLDFAWETQYHIESIKLCFFLFCFVYNLTHCTDWFSNMSAVPLLLMGGFQCILFAIFIFHFCYFFA